MTLSKTRGVTLAVLGLRVAYGVGLMAAPTRLGQRWLGPAAAAAPTQVPLRGLGAREIVLHVGAIGAVLRGAPLQPWLAGSVIGDLSDIVATVTGRDELPDGSVLATLLVGGSSALISIVLAAVAER